MEYLEKMLGVSVKYHRWKGELELPYYITERYEMRLVELDKMKCIFLWPKDKLSQIGSLKKQLRRIQMEEALPVVFIMDMIDAYRRTAFIKAHISFIVPDSQIYLPFMGTCLEEKYQINFDNRIIVQGSLQIIKGMVKNKLANVILPYYAIDKEIKNGEFKVIEEIVDVKDGYQVIVTKDKNTLVPIIKFLNFISSY